MQTTVSLFFNPSCFLRAATGNPKATPSGPTLKPSSGGTNASNVRSAASAAARSGKGGIAPAALVTGALVTAAGAYWYFSSTKTGQKAVAEVKEDLEKVKIDAKHGAHDLLDKAEKTGKEQLEHLEHLKDKAKDKAKEGLETAREKAKEGLEKAKKAL